ncbi:hypothetical protein LPB140_07020 [Sphingorhabdus lutea]|uniref:DUF962 domain-containing protein n=1 Tax=Sphingorhabdus lutea TaxID=1913578 RepID=A0A1L3JBQ8_9SPHN|nr:DUF962 domain-containing protein [Sphingorhabdus lutea]APG62575.1 hypothetical protein LPB140_07020 [Sphingorhabdus lutea]
MTHPQKRFSNFSEFYPYYLQEHSKPACRYFHYIGTFLSIMAFIFGLIFHPYWFLAMPLSGYSFAWFSHAFIEKNKPATFTYPLWSLIGDYKMFLSWLSGSIDQQIANANLLYPRPEKAFDNK